MLTLENDKVRLQLEQIASKSDSQQSIIEELQNRYKNQIKDIKTNF